MSKELKFHPLADIFPLMEGEEFDALVTDIKANGQHELIVVYDDQILDGRNRYRACLSASVEPQFTPFWGDDPVAFVISANLRRRHLNESQRAMVAAKLATLRLGDNQHSEGLPIGRGSELLNVGERSVARARYDELKRGRIRAKKLGKKTVILRSDAENWASSLPALNLAVAARS
jgi:hypothetical protein